MKLLLKKFIFIAMICGLFMMMTACANKHSNINSVDVKFQFLTVFFTSDYQQRYTTFAKSGDITDEKTLSKYYEELSTLVTTDCLDSLEKNREPMKYDKLAAEEDAQFIPADISVKLSDKKNSVYSFTLTLKDSTGKEKEQQRKGQLTTVKENGKIKISNYYISSGL